MKKREAKREAQGRSERDAGRRTVEVPADLRAALAKDEAAEARFDALPTSHRKEYVSWIEEAKKPETRAGRIAKTAAMLKAKPASRGQRR